MKKIGILFASALIVLSLASCGKNKDKQSITTNQPTTSKHSSENKDISDDNVYFGKLSEKFGKTSNFVEYDYNRSDYKILLREPSKYIPAKLKVSNLKILQLTELVDYTKYLASDDNGNAYMLFIENKKIDVKLLKYDDVTFFGRYVSAHKYSTSNGINTVPLIYVDGYQLNK